LVSGHKEKDESVLDALIRETKEEADIDIKAKDIKFISVMNRKT
jgi:8-oxo-dGTP pyrophosphatase MutT (NUDIX family)